MTDSELARFEAKVMPEPMSGCWLWVGALKTNGYGVMVVNRKWPVAHRTSYEHFVGPIPTGLDLDHLCRVRSCVNPRHVEPVTRQVNLLRGDTKTREHAAKTMCPRGHPYDMTTSKGGRWCLTCSHEASKNYYWSHRNAGS